MAEKGDRSGGLARTEVVNGYRFDIGGHRFYTNIPEVQQLWEEMLGDDFVRVPRLSRIHYEGLFYDYPLNLLNTLTNLGMIESLLILLSYFKAKLWPFPEERTFEQWVVNRFGQRLYETFFKTYTEKVWGIPCPTIRADWAAQRIMDLSLTTAVSKALFGSGFGSGNVKSLIDEFHYPVLGPGMMWQRFREAVERHGGKVHLNTEVISLEREEGRIRTVIMQRDGEVIKVSCEHVISSMPLNELIFRIIPPPADDVVQAARKLSYRAFIIVGLIINQADLFPDNWIYIHSPEVKVGRIQNFKNWSLAMVPNPHKTSLGLEYFCDEGDELWTMADAEIIALATRELVSLELATEDLVDVDSGIVIRQPKAYPVYDGEYRQHLEAIRQFLGTIDNLQTIGRNGLHRYNNQDHSMLTGMLAARNLLGDDHDVWNVNTDRSYYEQIQVNP